MASLGTSTVDAALASADELAQRGRYLDAVDQLTSVYRRDRDHRVARRLVELRNDAFAELPREPGRPEWPAAFDDPFPGREGLVEVDPGELSGELVGGAITHHGCLRINGLLDADTAAGFRDRIEQAFQGRDRLVDGEDPEAVAPWFDPFEQGRQKAEGFGRDLFVRAVDAPDALFDLTEVFERTGIRRAVADYLGERPAMIANKWVLRRSDGGMLLSDFHQDGAFLGEGIRTIDCWIALSPCGPGTDRPAVDLVAGRVDEILPTGEGSAFPWSLAEQTVLDAVPELPVVSPTFQPGDALLFDERLPHRTSIGTDLGTRYAIESWFVAPSSYPGKHVPVVL